MHDDDLALALELADTADSISMRYFQEQDLRHEKKPDGTFVTEGDQEVERAIRALISQRRPDDSILGEEFGTEGDSRRQWIIDPIDGTAHFMRGAPVWATLIALAIDGRPVVGVCSSPAFGKRWWAAEGGGAWTNPDSPERLEVSRVASLEDSAISYNSVQGWDLVGRLDALIDLQRHVWRARSYGDAWSYMLLAEGSVDAVAEFDLKPYDMAALVPIVTEAGGTFTSAEGRPGPWHGSAVATNSLLHDELLQRIQGDNHA
ncbi:histidinol-phosphatase [Agrococcus casei]|uniref:Histidinol-phosphatase n=1 Tax=Agrococcus casei LMG 22410 TaxID=1255656 RepID=A0A1R4FKL9_9MICO|nr:histidinol-phosphatase [Agrococcus casei]SJM56436.1 Histidinol-phosphatase [alternative form] [Agrococcus casei LMG 22410]